MAAKTHDGTSVIRARIEAALAVLVAKGWQISRNTPEAKPLLPERYRALPPEFVEFERLVAQCVAPSEQTWLMGVRDYQPVSAGSFRWNEYEMMTLDAVVGDEVETRKCREFWKTHIPVCMEVSGDYAFAAIVAETGPDYGRVVIGWGPDFEDPLPGPDSYLDLLDMIAEEWGGSMAGVLVAVRARLRQSTGSRRSHWS